MLGYKKYTMLWLGISLCPIPWHHALAVPIVEHLVSTNEYRVPSPAHVASSECLDRPASDKPLSLAEAITIALCNNPQTQAQWHSALSQVNAYGQAQGAYYPDVSGQLGASRDRTIVRNGDNSRSRSSDSGIGINYLLYDFGRRTLAVEQTRQALINANFTYDSALQALVFETINNYFFYQSARAAVESSKDVYHFDSEALKAAKLRYKNGLAAYADVLQAEASLSQSDLNITQTKNNLITAQAALSASMGLAPAENYSIAEYARDPKQEKAFFLNAQQAIDKAKKERPDLIAAAAQVESARLSLESAKRQNLPTISVNAGRTYTPYNPMSYKSANDSISLSVSIPFSVIGYHYNVKQAEETLKAQKLSYKKTQQDIALEVYSAWHNYDTTLKSLEAANQFLASSEEVRKIALGRYKEGIGAFLDILNAQQQYASARQKRNDAIYGVQTSKANLIRAMGVWESDVTKQMASGAP